jgi:uncharacterized protein with ParB-like and HNH nuclease domain
LEDFKNIIKSFNLIQMGELLRTRIFRVPPNQREYSWNKDNWLELWNDLLDIIREREKARSNTFYRYHFFGPMFFIEEQSEKELRILDGQQRIATVGILLTVIFDLLDRKRERFRISTEGAKVLGKIDECLFETREGRTNMRIILGKNNKTFYDKLLKLRRTDETNRTVDPILKINFLKNESRTSKSNSNILNCYKFFLENIVFYLCRQEDIQMTPRRRLDSETIDLILASERCENFLCKLYESVAEGLYVLNNIVPTSDIVYEMFETLNQRGEKLFVVDLFKNLIFERFETPLTTEKLQSFWDELSETAGDELDEFLRHFWLSNYEFIRMKKLFRAIRAKIEEQTPEEFEKFIQKMLEEAKIYFALRNPNDSRWLNYDDISQMLDELDYLRFRQGLPMLLSAYIVEFPQNPGKFKELLKTYLSFCVRAYTILGGNPNELEEEYSKWARQIRNRELTTEDVIDLIKENTPSDEEFKLGFINLKVNPATGKYIISKINDALVTSPLNRVWRNRPTLEHVIPRKPDEWWKNYLQSKRMRHKEFVDRLGNMTILSGPENKELGNLPYDQKREKYLEMNLPVNKETFEQFTEFDAETVKKREEILAELAIKHKVW